MTERIAMLLVGVCLVGVAALIAWMLAALLFPGQTIELRRVDWECVEVHPVTRLQPMLVGKVTVMMPTTSNVCVAYRRRP